MIRLYTLLICFTIVGCKNQKEATLTNKNVDSVTISESACEGSCPEYSMTIYEDGSAKFIGKAHTKVLGEQTYNYSKENLKELFANLKALNFESYKEAQSFMVDAPETMLEYNDKTIIIKDLTKIPEDFSTVLIALKKLTRSTSFVN